MAPPERSGAGTGSVLRVLRLDGTYPCSGSAGGGAAWERCHGGARYEVETMLPDGTAWMLLCEQHLRAWPDAWRLAVTAGLAVDVRYVD